MAENIEKCAPDDPNRCQAIASQGQCLNKAIPGGTVCMCHGGNRQIESVKAEGLRNYRLTKFQAQLERHSSSSGIKSLRDEVGILRMMMEERLNMCQSNTDLIINSTAISDLVMKIDRVVTSCHKLEGSMGQLLDKQAILQFGSEVIGIISAEISDEPTLQVISNKLMEAITRCTDLSASYENELVVD